MRICQVNPRKKPRRIYLEDEIWEKLKSKAEREKREKALKKLSVSKYLRELIRSEER